MKHYTAQGLNKAFSSLENSESVLAQQIQNELYDRVINNLEMTISESNFICSRLNVNHYKACEDYIFKTHYLIYRNNLDGSKPAYNFWGESLKNEKEEHLKKLHEDYQNWKTLIEKHHHKEILLNLVSREVGIEIKKLKKSYKTNKEGYANYEVKEKAIILQSKYLYLTVKKIFEDLAIDHIEVDFINSKIIINQDSTVHIMWRHMAGSTKQFDTEKSFLFDKTIPHDKVIFFIESILMEISQSQLYDGSIEYMPFKFRNIKYAFRTNEIKGSLSNFKLTTFYPIEDKKKLDELDKYYREVKINDNLSVFTLVKI
ncbi:MAG: hypothetical protein ABI723_13280 [Bacteroidia bacterium]